MRITRQIGAALLLVACAAPAPSSTIHKWVDDDGITHYSDTPPGAPAIEFERIDLPDTAASTVKRADDYYSIANQWQRMHRERIERERARAERAESVDTAARDGNTIVIQVLETRSPVAILPRHRPGLIKRNPLKFPTRRHPFAIPGRDWPVGLHPGRNDLRARFKAP